MSALTATGEVQPRYFYGAGWSDELRSGGSPVFSKSRDISRRWVPAAWELSRALQGFAFAREATPDRFDFYHEPDFLLLGERLPAIVTVHDLSFVHYPETHPAGRVRVVTRRLPRARC
jgi:alpha-1,3-rhamnosyl/mannosyltransferase